MADRWQMLARRNVRQMTLHGNENDLHDCVRTDHFGAISLCVSAFLRLTLRVSFHKISQSPFGLLGHVSMSDTDTHAGGFPKERKQKKHKKKKRKRKHEEARIRGDTSPEPDVIERFMRAKRQKEEREAASTREDSGDHLDEAVEQIRSVSTTVAVATSAKRFEHMGLKENLLKGIFNFGFSQPSAIQQKAIMPIIAGRDVIAQSQSGTGKTAVMCIGSLQRLAENKPHVQVVIISPTRELAEQTASVMTALGDYLNVKCFACVGGKIMGQGIKRFEKGCQVVSGTPGRVLDMLRRQILKVNAVRMLVVDEADEMLEKGLKEQIYEIYRNLPRGLQVVLISATMSPEVLEMTEEFMDQPISILVKQEQVSLEGIKQFYVNVEEEEWKFDTLRDIYEMANVTQTVVFCNTRKKVEWLAKKMKENHFTVSSIHGKMQQKDRDRVTREFRSGKSRVLIATDIWGRGIDVQQVSLVICYDLPPKVEFYIHRIGRSGRFGRKGCSINLLAGKEDVAYLRRLERHYSVKIVQMPGDIKPYLV